MSSSGRAVSSRGTRALLPGTAPSWPVLTGSGRPPRVRPATVRRPPGDRLPSVRRRSARGRHLRAV